MEKYPEIRKSDIEKKNCKLCVSAVDKIAIFANYSDRKSRISSVSRVKYGKICQSVIDKKNAKFVDHSREKIANFVTRSLKKVTNILNRSLILKNLEFSQSLTVKSREVIQSVAENMAKFVSRSLTKIANCFNHLPIIMAFNFIKHHYETFLLLFF